MRYFEFAAEAVATGARALLVLPAGPEQEGGEASLTQEERLLEIVRGGGLRMVGPSSLGILNTDPEVSLNATFTGARVRAGGLAICSPSGAIGIGLLGHASARRLGVSMFASLGNRADVSTNDMLECWEQDERTAAVILYVESFGSPERFTRIARRVSRSKPILAVKGRRRAEQLLGDSGIDALMVFYIDFYNGDPEAVLDVISAVSEGQAKPVVASVLSSDGQLSARTGLGVPNYLFPESCAAVLSRAAERREMAFAAARRASALSRPRRAGRASGDLVVS